MKDRAIGRREVIEKAKHCYNRLLVSGTSESCLQHLLASAWPSLTFLAAMETPDVNQVERIVSKVQGGGEGWSGDQSLEICRKYLNKNHRRERRTHLGLCKRQC